MPEWKTLVGLLAIFITVIGYYPYLRDIVSGKTKPHIYSWFLFGFINLTVYALQVQGGGGFGCFATLTSSLLIFVVFFLSLRAKNKPRITRSDTIFLVLTLTSLLLWAYAKQPTFSAVLLTLTNLLAYGPTIRKSWSQPHTETLSFFLINVVRFSLVLISLQKYSWQTALYPVAELGMHSFIVCMLSIRRKQCQLN